MEVTRKLYFSLNALTKINLPRFHHAYFDNYFSSIPLLLSLSKDACGTLRSNRKGFPRELITHMKKGLQKGLQSRGDYIIRQCSGAKGEGWTRNRKQSNRLALVWQRCSCCLHKL